MSERIAFLGLGIMGRPMAANLRTAGFDVVAWNRTRERADEFAREHGAEVADTPAAAAADAAMTITMVPDSPEVESVLLGESGAAEGLGDGGLAVDMSTIAPSATRRIAERLSSRGIRMLDAPVTGSRPKAEAATLTIMAGGAAEDFERARPALEAMGELVLHVGPQGHGSMIKLINNTVAAANAVALAEALALATRAGVDPAALRRVMAAGSGASAMLDLKAEPMLERDYEALFKLEHMLKDVRHCLAEAEALGYRPRVAGETERLYAEADERGLGGSDFAAVYEIAKPPDG
jgi:3-hydroxyisobutyrate dehydrogenase-like beta-hydroxyacid dehydrogenase